RPAGPQSHPVPRLCRLGHQRAFGRRARRRVLLLQATPAGGSGPRAAGWRAADASDRLRAPEIPGVSGRYPTIQLIEYSILNIRCKRSRVEGDKATERRGPEAHPGHAAPEETGEGRLRLRVGGERFSRLRPSEEGSGSERRIALTMTDALTAKVSS